MRCFDDEVNHGYVELFDKYKEILGEFENLLEKTQIVKNNNYSLSKENLSLNDN